MKPVRLLPIVVMAGSALLGLKLIGLASGTGYTLTGISAVVAQDAPAQAGEGAMDTPADAAADAAAAGAASELLFGADADQPGTMPAVEGLTPGQSTEEALAARLVERRAELNAFESELNERLALVEAAERRLDERMAELTALEERINGMVEAQGEAHRAQFAGVVDMYGGMRARDAATIFNNLDMTVLVEVARAMPPRTLGPIVAEMDPLRAQDLTVQLAAPQSPEFATVAEEAAPDTELPQIVGQ